MKKHFPVYAVFFCLVLGMLAGSFVGKDNAFWLSLFDLGGKLFMNALMLVIVPLVSSAIITSFSRSRGVSGFGRLGAKIIFWFVTLNFSAIFLSFLLTNLFSNAITVSAETLRHAGKIDALGDVSDPYQHIFDLFLQIVPPNIVGAFAEGQMLSIIFFSLIFGYLVTKIEKEAASTIHNFCQGVFQIMVKFTQIIMQFIPLGIFFLIAKQFALTGWRSLEPLFIYSVIMVMGFLLFMLVVLPLFLKFVAKAAPYRILKAMSPALVVAFSTCSSAACLPVTLNSVEKNVGVSNRISSVVLPLGLSLNLAGSAFYIFMTVIFVMQVHGMAITLPLQIIVLFLTLLFGFGIVGIPSAALIVSLTILKIFNIPTEEIGIFLAVDRFIDMFRTMTNVFTHATSAVLVSASEGEKLL